MRDVDFQCLTKHLSTAGFGRSRLQPKSRGRYFLHRPLDFCVRLIGLEPTHLAIPDPKSGASANFATSAAALRRRGREKRCKDSAFSRAEKAAATFFLPEWLFVSPLRGLRGGYTRHEGRELSSFVQSRVIVICVSPSLLPIPHRMFLSFPNDSKNSWIKFV